MSIDEIDKRVLAATVEVVYDTSFVVALGLSMVLVGNDVTSNIIIF